MSGSKIRELRETLHWTQEQMARYLCFCHRNQVSRIEQEGATGPTAKLLELLAANPAKGIVEATDLIKKPTREVTPAMMAILRRRKGMTQEEYAELLGVTKWYIRDLEKGNRRIHKRLSRLVLALK